MSTKRFARCFLRDKIIKRLPFPTDTMNNKGCVVHLGEVVAACNFVGEEKFQNAWNMSRLKKPVSC